MIETTQTNTFFSTEAYVTVAIISIVVLLICGATINTAERKDVADGKHYRETLLLIAGITAFVVFTLSSMATFLILRGSGYTTTIQQEAAFVEETYGMKTTRYQDNIVFTDSEGNSKECELTYLGPGTAKGRPAVLLSNGTEPTKVKDAP